MSLNYERYDAFLDLCVPIETLEIGQEFVFWTHFYHYDREVAIGELVDIGVGTVVVDVITDDGTKGHQRWQPATPVIAIDPTVDYQKLKELNMATPNPKLANMMQRIKFITNQLLNGSDDQKATAKERLIKLREESKSTGVIMNAPANYDELMGNETFFEVFADYEFGAPSKTKPTKAQQDEAAAETITTAQAETKAVKLSGTTKTPREKKVKEAQACLDGCGGITRGGKFLAGHDAKLKSILLKIERGEEPITAIPEAAAPFCKYDKNGSETVKSKDGKVEEQVTLYYFSESPVKLPNRKPVAA